MIEVRYTENYTLAWPGWTPWSVYETPHLHLVAWSKDADVREFCSWFWQMVHNVPLQDWLS